MSNNKSVCKLAIDLIVSFESIAKIGADGRVYPYHDAVGYPTIGIGHLLSKIKFEPLDKYGSLTIDESHNLHHEDLDIFAVGVNKLVDVDLSDNEFGAIVSLAFNIGLGNLGSSTLIKKLNLGNSKIDIASEFLKWNKAGGQVLAGLTRRRVAEKTLFLT